MLSIKHIILMLVGFLFACSVFAANQQPLPVDDAFQLSVKNIQDNSVQLHWDIAENYHLYKDKFHFVLDDESKDELGQVNLPAGIPTHDDILGDYEIYNKTVDLAVPFKKIEERNTVLLVTYQGCSENGFCYPPVTKHLTINFQGLAQPTIINSVEASSVSLQDRVTHLLEKKNYFLICFVFIGLGLLLAFTPCVLPMIPILSGIIVGQDRENLTTRRAFFLSLSYVLGMSFTYAGAGVLVSLAGNHLSETFQIPWVIILFSLLFVVLALSLFGFYELKLPYFIQHRILHLSNKQKTGSYAGAIMMGALSVLIVSPCVTAPLVGVLTFIGQSGDIVLGSIALFSLGLGMGLPLIIIGTTEGRFLPKSGPWMNVVKSSFGILLIGVAIYLLQRILPASVSLMIWAGFMIILGFYLGVGAPHRRVSSGWIKFGKGLGLLFFCYGIILLVGGALGNKDFFSPLQSNKTIVAENALNFQAIKNFSELQNALSDARKQNKVALLDYYADWCVACHEMDKSTFSDPKVKEALKNIILLRIDITTNDAQTRSLQDYFNVIAPPTILFFDKEGKELKEFRIIGSMSSQDFLQHLQYIHFN
jgi:thiol:disulfide interchange protein DsbD